MKFKIGSKVKVPYYDYRTREVKCKVCKGEGILFRKDKSEVVCINCYGRKVVTQNYKIKKSYNGIISKIKTIETKTNKWTEYNVEYGKNYIDWFRANDLKKINQ